MFCMTLRARLAAGILAIAIVLVTPLTLALRSLDQLHASVIQLRNLNGSSFAPKAVI